MPVTGVFVVDQSRKSRTANAAVTGLGRTRRILLFDTLLDQFTAEEIEAVLAHELAHQLHGDIRRGLLVQGALTLVTFWIADLALRWGVGWLGLAGPADIAGLPLFGLILVLVSLAALPVANGWSRRVEWQADRFALETIRRSARLHRVHGAAGHAQSGRARPPSPRGVLPLLPPGDRAPDRPRAAVSSRSDLTVCRERIARGFQGPPGSNLNSCYTWYY